MTNFSIQAKLLDKGYNIDAFTEGTIAMLRMAVGGIAVAAQNEWVRLAQSRLHTTRDMYINGLRQAGSFGAKTGTDVDVYEIKLVGTMPNNVEFGMPQFDMKAVRPGWLGGSKAKTAKDGHKYIMIPFRHSTSSDTRMAYTGKAAAVSDPNLKTQLKTTMKQYGLDRMIRSATGKVIEGPVARVPNVDTVHPYLRGLTRVQKAAGGTTSTGKQRGSSTMTTWRIMSENSPAGSWIHPGIPAANLLSEVEIFVDQQLDKIIADLLAV